MTILEVIDRVLSKLGEPSAIAGPEIEAAIPSCLSLFATRVAFSSTPFTRELLRKDFSVTVTSGVGDLTPHLTAAEPLLIESIPAGTLFATAGTVPLQWLPDRVQLSLQRSTLFVYYTIDKSSLLTRNTDNSLTSLTTTVTLTGSYVPIISTVPELLEDDFVEFVTQYLAKPAAQ